MDVTPPANLPPDAQPWGRWVVAAIKTFSGALDKLTGAVEQLRKAQDNNFTSNVRYQQYIDSLRVYDSTGISYSELIPQGSVQRDNLGTPLQVTLATRSKVRVTVGFSYRTTMNSSGTPGFDISVIPTYKPVGAALVPGGPLLGGAAPGYHSLRLYVGTSVVTNTFGNDLKGTAIVELDEGTWVFGMSANFDTFTTNTASTLMMDPSIQVEVLGKA